MSMCVSIIDTDSWFFLLIIATIYCVIGFSVFLFRNVWNYWSPVSICEKYIMIELNYQDNFTQL